MVENTTGESVVFNLPFTNREELVENERMERNLGDSDHEMIKF